MYSLLIILMVITSLLMCFIVLIQNSKGGGLASGFSSSNQIMGVRKTTDFLEKATWTLAAVMVLCSVFTAYALRSGSTSTGSVIEQAAMENATQKAAPFSDAPVQETAPAQETTPAEQAPATDSAE